MSITDELRKFIEDPLLGIASQDLHIEVLTKIADSIDAEHERACKEQYACGAEHGIGTSIEASMIQEHGFIELPKDADGVPWHLGDKDEDGRVVTHLNLSNEGWGLGLSTHSYDLSYSSHFPHYRRHHHAPTVEDVLHDFICDHEEGVRDEADLIAEYAAKLRLAGDTE